MQIVLALLMAVNHGANIKNPNPDKIVIVRTDQQPRSNHHKILDDQKYARLYPYMVSVKAKNGMAIHVITVQFDVIAEDGSVHHFPHIYSKHPEINDMPIQRGDSSEFWPTGHMPRKIPGNPLVSTPPDSTVDMIEHAQSVTFSVDFVQFEDGTIIGPDQLDTRGALKRDAIASARQDARKGAK